jgi:hypothetical protein
MHEDIELLLPLGYNVSYETKPTTEERNDCLVISETSEDIGYDSTTDTEGYIVSDIQVWIRQRGSLLTLKNCKNDLRALSKTLLNADRIGDKSITWVRGGKIHYMGIDELDNMSFSINFTIRYTHI